MQEYLPVPEPEEEEILNKRFLIICEGANTEKYYFEAFPVPSKVVEVFGGFGGGKVYLVNEAIKRAALPEYQGYEVWCVFDYDIKHDNERQSDDYNKAIITAEQHGFMVAFSNDAFELWLLLHYQYITNQHHRAEYYEMLTERWADFLNGQSYEKVGKSIFLCKSLYKKLEPDQPMAIKLAKRLHQAHFITTKYHEKNPCTTVYTLVEELNKYKLK